MLSCFFSSPPAPPLFQNFLLSDPSIRLNKTSWDANYYDILATASLVVFVAINIFAISYCALVAAEYVYHVVTAGVLLFPPYFSVIYAPYKAASIEKSQEHKLEALTNRHIKEITDQCTVSVDKASYLRSLHHQIGAKQLSNELQAYMVRESHKTDPYETLIPLYARALAYNDLAREKLKEISFVFFTPAQPIEKRNIQELNYQELLALYNDPATPMEQREFADRALSTREIAWTKLENAYLEDRLKASQIASIASHPIHPGIPSGFCRTYTDIVAETSEARYRKSFARGAFFHFDSSNSGLTREGLIKLHTDSANTVFYASLNHMIQSGQIRIDFNDPSGQHIDYRSAFAKEITSFHANLSPTEWNELSAATYHFLRSHIPANPDGSYSISQIHLLLYWQGNRKNLLSYPIIEKLVHTDTAHKLEETLSERDPNKIENRILSFLFSALPLRFPGEFSQSSIPSGLLINGSSYQELLKSALLPPHFSFSDQELVCVRNFLQGIQRVPSNPLDTVSTTDKARLDPNLQQLASQMTRRFYLS